MKLFEHPDFDQLVVRAADHFRSRAPPVPPGPAYGSRPHRLGRHKTPPTRSTGKVVVLFEHDVTGRTRAPVKKPMGGNSPRIVAVLRRAFTFAGIPVHDPRIRRSTSPEYGGNRAAANPRPNADRRRRHCGRRRQGHHRDTTGRRLTAASKSTEIVAGNDPGAERTGCSAAEKLGDFDDTHHGRMNPEPHSASWSHR